MSMPDFAAALDAFSNALKRDSLNLDTTKQREQLVQVVRTLNLDRVPGKVIDAYENMVKVTLDAIDEAE